MRILLRVQPQRWLLVQLLLLRRVLLQVWGEGQRSRQAAAQVRVPQLRQVQPWGGSRGGRAGEEAAAVQAVASQHLHRQTSNRVGIRRRVAEGEGAGDLQNSRRRRRRRQAPARSAALTASGAAGGMPSMAGSPGSDACSSGCEACSASWSPPCACSASCPLLPPPPWGSAGGDCGTVVGGRGWAPSAASWCPSRPASQSSGSAMPSARPSSSISCAVGQNSSAGGGSAIRAAVGGLPACTARQPCTDSGRTALSGFRRAVGLEVGAQLPASEAAVSR